VPKAKSASAAQKPAEAPEIPFFFPDAGVTILAADLQEAERKLALLKS
jgi:hypothetical protein